MTKKQIKKTANDLSIQKDIIFAWTQKNVKNTTLNYRLEIADIYKKFIKDLNIEPNILTSVAFGSVFSTALEELEIPFKRGYNTQYYGIYVEGVRGKSAIIDTTIRNTGGKFDFDIINEKNLKKWLEDCVIIYPKENNKPIPYKFTPINDLFLNFCYYFNLDLKTTHGNKILFGKELAAVLKKSPKKYNLKRVKSPKSGRSGYLNIKELKQTKETITNTYTLQTTKPKTYKYLILAGIGLFIFGILGWILYNN